MLIRLHVFKAGSTRWEKFPSARTMLPTQAVDPKFNSGKNAHDSAEQNRIGVEVVVLNLQAKMKEGDTSP